MSVSKIPDLYDENPNQGHRGKWEKSILAPSKSLHGLPTGFFFQEALESTFNSQ